MLTIAGVASLAAVLNALFPAISQSSSALVAASAKVDDRLKSDIEIIHVVGELNSAGAFSDTNANGRFEIFIWVKNVGDTRILNLSRFDVFVGTTSTFTRIPHLDEVDPSVFPRWQQDVEGDSDDSEMSPKETVKITVDYDSSTQAQGDYDVKIIIPNGVTDEYFFSM